MISIDLSSPVPPSEQLRAGLHDLIRSGVIGDGDRLPSVRQLAADLELAPGTVARAYTQLEEAGLTVSTRGGTRARRADGPDEATRRATERLVQGAKKAGVGLDDLVALVRVAWSADRPVRPEAMS